MVVPKINTQVKWVNVKDKYPKDDINVLVYDRGLYNVNLRKNNKWSNNLNHCLILAHISHWVSLDTKFIELNNDKRNKYYLIKTGKNSYDVGYYNDNGILYDLFGNKISYVIFELKVMELPEVTKEMKNII